MAAIPAAMVASHIGTTTFGAAFAGFLVTAAGSYIDNAYLIPRLFHESPETPSLGSVDANYADEGSGAQYTYGNLNRVAGQYIYVSRPYSRRTGGGSTKRGSLPQITWYVDAAIAFCWNEIGRYNALLMDGEKVYDADPGLTVLVQESDLDLYLDNTNSVQHWEYQIGGWFLIRWYATFEADAATYPKLFHFRSGNNISVTDTLGADLDLSVVNAAIVNAGATVRLSVDLKNYYQGTGFSVSQNAPNNPPTVSPSNYPWQGTQTPSADWTFDDLDAFTTNWIKNLLVFEGNAEFWLGKNQPQQSDVIGGAFGGPAPGLPGLAYIGLPGLNVSRFGNRAPHVTGLISQSDNSLTAPVEQRTVDQAITHLAKSVGGVPAAYVSPSTSGDISGLSWAGTQETHALLAQVMLAYELEKVESGGVLQFRPKASAAPANIDPAYLSTRPVGAPYRSRIEGLTEVDRAAIPRRINISYPSAEAKRDLQDSSQHATRDGLQDANATDSETRQARLAIPMTDVEARALAASMLQAVWEDTATATIRLPWIFAHLTESDTINLTEDVDGRSWSMTITQVDHSATFDVVCKVSVHVDQTARIAFAGASGSSTSFDTEIYGYQSQARFLPGSAIIFDVLDLPPLRHQDGDVPGVYVATGYPDPRAPWRGAEIFMASEDNDAYVKVGTGRQATVGNAAGGSVLADASAGTFDAVSTVTVRLLTGGPLSNVTQEEAAAGRNLCVIGAELCSFTTAALQADGSYILSGFYRGRLATESATSGHTDSNERFVLLNESVVHVPIDLTHQGRQRDFQVLVPGQALAANPGYTLGSFEANTIRSAPPANLAGYREPDNDVALTWERRSRVPVNDLGPTVVPLPEYSESYILYIDDSGGDLVRTVTGLTSPSYTYTAAMQTTDGTNASDFTARVVQVDAISGDGRQATLLVPAP